MNEKTTNGEKLWCTEKKNVSDKTEHENKSVEKQRKWMKKKHKSF